MTMLTIDPFRDFDLLRREVDRAFEAISGTRRNAFLPGRASRVYPLVNVREDADTVLVEALAPGLDPETIEVSVMRNQLTISGEKAATNNGVAPEAFHRSERAVGRFVRTLTLPAEIDEAKVTAEYRQGVLLLTLPKAEHAKPRRITVAVS
jgi:HSP20 family protein